MLLKTRFKKKSSSAASGYIYQLVTKSEAYVFTERNLFIENYTQRSVSGVFISIFHSHESYIHKIGIRHIPVGILLSNTTVCTHGSTDHSHTQIIPTHRSFPHADPLSRLLLATFYFTTDMDVSGHPS